MAHKVQLNGRRYFVQREEGPLHDGVTPFEELEVSEKITI
jgi:hypothetical protein